jgi:hypothetical protein
MRPISWIDPRMRNEGSAAGVAVFFHRHGVGPMANDGHHGEGEPDRPDMPVPAMPGASNSHYGAGDGMGCDRLNRSAIGQ